MKDFIRNDNAGVKSSNNTIRAAVAAAVMCLASLAMAAPALGQNSKVSEQDLQSEIEGQGWPLTIRRAPAQSRIADRYIVLFRPEVTVPRQEARRIVRQLGGKIH